MHALLVPLRSEAGEVLEGIRLEDCGSKLGLDGVDNGRLWFDAVRVPRENLLDRYATVSEEGVYHSAIESPTKRFFAMLATLIQGRRRWWPRWWSASAATTTRRGASWRRWPPA